MARFASVVVCVMLLAALCAVEIRAEVRIRNDQCFFSLRAFAFALERSRRSLCQFRVSSAAPPPSSVATIATLSCFRGSFSFSISRFLVSLVYFDRILSCLFVRSFSFCPTLASPICSPRLSGRLGRVLQGVCHVDEEPRQEHGCDHQGMCTRRVCFLFFLLPAFTYSPVGLPLDQH